MRYRIHLPTMVLASRDNHEAAVTIPAGTIIDVIGSVESDDRFVAIRSGDELFHIFASDLASRADRVADGERARVSRRRAPRHERKPRAREASPVASRAREQRRVPLPFQTGPRYGVKHEPEDANASAARRRRLCRQGRREPVTAHDLRHLYRVWRAASGGVDHLSGLAEILRTDRGRCDDA